MEAGTVDMGKNHSVTLFQAEIPSLKMWGAAGTSLPVVEEDEVATPEAERVAWVQQQALLYM